LFGGAPDSGRIPLKPGQAAVREISSLRRTSQIHLRKSGRGFSAALDRMPDKDKILTVVISIIIINIL